MILYIFIFFAIVVLASSVQDEVQQKRYFAICMVFLALFVGLADMLGGYDRYIYGELFDNAVDTMRSGWKFFDTALVDMYGSEFGYCIWNFLVGLITRNRYIYIMLTTFFVYFFFWRAIKNQTENPMFALIIFMALTFFFSFTYIRQIMAAAIAWQAIPYIEKRNLKMFCFWLFLAFTFHHSAIVFFPVYFIPFRKFDLNTVDILMVICLVLGLIGIANGLFEAYNSMEARGNNIATESGFRIAYFVESLFFYYFIRTYYDYLGNDEKSLIGLNLSIMFCCILLLFIKSENGGRLSWFFMIGLYNMMTMIFSGKSRISNPLFIVIVCFFLYFRILYAWSFLLYPYKTFLTPGIRDNDPIEAHYEYDHGYDNDKFYR